MILSLSVVLHCSTLNSGTSLQTLMMCSQVSQESVIRGHTWDSPMRPSLIHAHPSPMYTMWVYKDLYLLTEIMQGQKYSCGVHSLSGIHPWLVKDVYFRVDGEGTRATCRPLINNHWKKKWKQPLRLYVSPWKHIRGRRCNLFRRNARDFESCCLENLWCENDTWRLKMSCEVPTMCLGRPV